MEERDDEPIQHVEFCTEEPRGGLWLDATGACDTRADRAREWQATRREKGKGIKL